MQDNVLAVGMQEAARRLGVSPRTIATLIAHGELLSCKIGRRRVIAVEALEKFLRRDHPTVKGLPNRTPAQRLQPSDKKA